MPGPDDTIQQRKRLLEQRTGLVEAALLVEIVGKVVQLQAHARMIRPQQSPIHRERLARHGNRSREVSTALEHLREIVHHRRHCRGIASGSLCIERQAVVVERLCFRIAPLELAHAPERMHDVGFGSRPGAGQSPLHRERLVEIGLR